MALLFLTAVGAFIVGLTVRLIFQRLRRPWIATLVLLLPALYYGCVYLFRSPTQEALDSLVWAGALAVGGMAAEIAFRSS